MRVSMPLVEAGDPRAAAEQVAELERAGLDAVWVAEAYGYDAVSVMGYLAARTSRVEIGSGILPIYSRSPALLAQTAAGLDRLSGGRAILGLGVSGPRVIEGWHGVAYDRPLARLREVVEICRRVWRREVLTFQGACYTLPLPAEQGSGQGRALKLVPHPLRERIPIYLAALGERSVELAAEVADGWLPAFFLPERAGAVWGAALARGLARRQAGLGPLEIVAGGPTAIGEGLEHLRDQARGQVALYMGGMGARGRNFYNDLLRRYGFEAEAERIQELYLGGQRAEAAAAVPTALLEGTSLIGPAPYVKERIAAYRAAGVTMLQVTPLGDDPARTIARVRELVAQAG